jgi:hypothetical protein
MDFGSEHSEKKAPHLTTAVNENDIDIAAFAASSEGQLDPQVAARLRFVKAG